MRPFIKHCIKLAWPGIINPCQGQGLESCQKFHLCQKIVIIVGNSASTLLSASMSGLPHYKGRHQTIRHIFHRNTPTDKLTCLPHNFPLQGPTRIMYNSKKLSFCHLYNIMQPQYQEFSALIPKKSSHQVQAYSTRGVSFHDWPQYIRQNIRA